MNVIHIARAPVTGVWSVMRNLARWQQKNGHRVALGILIPKSWPEPYRAQLAELEQEGIKVFSAWSPNIFGTGAFLWHRFHNPISSWARDFRSEADGKVTLHFHNAWLSGALLPKPSDMVSCFVTYHGIAGESALRAQPVRRRLHGSWARRMMRYGAGHISVDRRAPLVAAELFRVDAARFQVVPNGVSGPVGHPLGCPRLHDLTAPFTVGHVGVIDDGKGWRITAEAVASLHQSGRSVRMIIAGSGPESVAAQQWCEHHASFAEYLGFVTDPVSTVFPRLDALALPSRREGLPMALLEALSQGVPIIATAVGGIPEAITDGVNGFLVERSKAAIRDRLSQLMDAPARQSQISLAARMVYEARYSQKAMGVAYARIYEGKC